MNKNPKEKKKVPSGGLSRRGFLGSAGAGVLGAVIAGKTAAGQDAPKTEDQPAKLTLTVNGQRHALSVEPRWTLLYVLREKLGLMGAKPGCERGECGGCTVLIDGEPRYGCMTLALEAESREITTVEGLMDGEQLGPVQRAFVKEDGMQCGFCTPGQIMAAEGLLRRNPDPSLDEIREGMSGNLCRCGAYDHIFKSVKLAATLKKGGAA